MHGGIMLLFDKKQRRKSRFPFVVLCKVPDTLRPLNYFWVQKEGGGGRVNFLFALDE